MNVPMDFITIQFLLLYDPIFLRSDRTISNHAGNNKYILKSRFITRRFTITVLHIRYFIISLGFRES